MDLVASCAAFVAVSRYGSFTRGAAAAGIPQSVASRRIAALEQHLGAPVLERSSRTVLLTAFGRDMLPAATRLADLAEALLDDAERARQQVFGLAVPDTCPPAGLAVLIAEGRRHGLYFDVVPAGPGERVELLRTQQVRAALVAVPPDEGGWTVPLGLAGVGALPARIEQLRVSRDGDAEERRIWLQPEDVVPHVHDRVVRLGHAVGLRPAQIRTARTVPGAVAPALSGGDLVLCSAAEAASYGLGWRAADPFGRGYALSTISKQEGARMRTALTPAMADVLGARPVAGAPAEPRAEGRS